MEPILENYTLDTWNNEIIFTDEKVIPYDCSKCSIANNRIATFPSYPVLRENRIIIVGEFPSYESIYYKNAQGETSISPNPFYGKTWTILSRAFEYLNLHYTFFSYTPLIRCWRNSNVVLTKENYETCRNEHLNKFITISGAPLIIALGSTVAKY